MDFVVKHLDGRPPQQEFGRVCRRPSTKNNANGYALRAVAHPCSSERVYVGPTCSSVAPSRGLLRTLKPNVSPKGLQTPRSNCLENTHVCTTSKIFTLTFDSLPGVPTCEMHDVLDPRSAWWVLTSLSFRGQTYFSPCQTDLKLLMCSATQSTALLHCASVPTGV